MAAATLGALGVQWTAVLDAAASAHAGAALRWTLPLLAVALLVRWRRLGPRGRHGAFTVALMGLLALPVLGPWLPRWAGPWSGAASSHPTSTPPVTPSAAAQPEADGSAALNIGATAPVPGPEADRARQGVAPGWSGIPMDAAADPAATAGFVDGLRAAWPWLWGAVASMLLAYAGLGAWGVRLWLASSSPGGPELRRAVDRAAATLGLRRPPRIRITERRSSPFVTGWLRPVVVLPAAWRDWSAASLDACLLHELAHVRRRDPLRLLVSRLAVALFWFHPGVWWAARKLRSAGELACDDTVVATGLDPHTYAAQLLDLARAFGPATSAAPSAALAMVRPGNLEIRLRSLVARRPSALPRGLRLGLLTGIATLMVLAGGLGQVTAKPSAVAPGSEGDWLQREDGGPVNVRWRMRCDGASAICRDGHRKASALLEQAGGRGAIVVQEVSTGELKVYASAGAEAVPLEPPASVAKLALATLWWDAGLPDGHRECTKTWTTPAGVDIWSARDLGKIEVPAGMLATSCNSAAAKMGVDLLGNHMDGAEIRRRLAELGFGEVRSTSASPVDGGFWGGAAFSAPPRPWAGRSKDTWNRDWPKLAAGGGPMVTTPLHVAGLLQAIGNGGVRLPTRAPGQATSAGGRRILEAQTAEKLRRAMEQVVHEGTGKRIAPQLEWSAWRLGGKTGTRQHEDGSFDGWFAGLATDATGTDRYAVAVWIEGGMGSGPPAGIAAEMTRFLARMSGDEL
ncbi:MAG: M56 family metallopeptidase [Acidobacteriota bacterium]